MLVLFILLLFGIGMSFFATQNTGTVHLMIGNTVLQSIPLYIVVTGSLLLGVFISWLISLVNTFSSSMTLHGKVAEVQKAQKTIDKLQEENHALELKISRLESANTHETPEHENRKTSEEKPSFLNRLSHPAM